MYLGPHAAEAGNGDMFKRKRERLESEPTGRRERGQESLAPISVGRVCALQLEVQLISPWLKIRSLNH